MLLTTSELYTHAVAKSADEMKTGGGTTGKTGFLQWRNKALPMLDINYRWSPVVLDARGNGGRSADEMKALAYKGYGPEDGVHAGDRAPDAPALVDAAGAETALFDIFKPYRHTVLLFVGADEKAVAEVVEVAQRWPAGRAEVVILGSDAVPATVGGTRAYHDKGHHAFDAYHIGTGTFAAVVVRPDGYVGAFVYGAEGVREYFAKIFKTA